MSLGEAIIRDGDLGLSIEYEDYDVEYFDGADYEVHYSLNAESRKKLIGALQAEGRTGTLKEMILSHFGTCLEKDSFCCYCDERGIQYGLFTWNS